jgi:uncharacterized membrane protein
VSLFYRIAFSILGIPIEYVLVCIMVAVTVVAFVFGIGYAVSKERMARSEVKQTDSVTPTQTL